MKLASRPYLFVITIFLLVLHVPAKSGKSCGNSGSFGVGSAAENGGHGKEIRTPFSSEAYMFHMGMLSCLSLVQQLTYKKRPKFGTSAAMFFLWIVKIVEWGEADSLVFQDERKGFQVCVMVESIRWVLLHRRTILQVILLPELERRL